LELDFLKIIAILLVIVSHLRFFTFFHIPQAISDYSAFLGVGTFFFVSGYTLRHSYGHIGSWGEIKRYYTRRVLRIFPPYWIVLLIYVLFITWVKIDNLSFLVYIFGLQELFYWYYPFIINALWFVGGILIFYVVFSLLATVTSTLRGFLSFAITIFVVYFLLRCVIFATYVMDPYMFVWYFVFIAGVVTCDILPYGKMLRPQVRNALLITVLGLFAFSLLAYHLEIQGHFTMITDATSVLFTVILIDAFCISFILASLICLREATPFLKKTSASIITALAFSCYGVYMIHGIILEAVNSIWFKYALGSSLDTYSIIGSYSIGNFVHDLVIVVGAVALSFFAGYLLMWHMERFRYRVGMWRREHHKSSHSLREISGRAGSLEKAAGDGISMKAERDKQT
jgi:peptidoglycan/LPS O-acetylase OafA/YrhL